MSDFRNQYLSSPLLDAIMRPGPVIKPHWEEAEPFKVHWELPDQIKMEDPLLPEPHHEMLLRDVGVQDIVDAVTIHTNGNELSVSWNGEVLKKLIPEQRQVIVAHLGHILYGYMHCDSNMVKDYIIKAKFHYHVQTLANIEEEPGEFA